MIRIKKQKKAIDAETLIEKFIATLEPVSKESTCVRYRQDIWPFHRWLECNQILLDKLRRKHLVQWFVYLNRQDYKAITIIHRLICVRVYLRWLHDEGLISADPDDLIRAGDIPKKPQYLPRPIPLEADAVLQKRLAANSDIIYQGLLLMRRTGLRISELCSLPCACTTIDPQGRHFLKVPLSKLDKERLVPLDELSVKTVAQLQGQNPKSRDFLIQYASGKRPAYHHYRQALLTLCKDLDIPERMTTHRLRHTFATTMLNAGMSLVNVMKILGHHTLAMTLKYADVTLESVTTEYVQAVKKLENKYQWKLSYATKDTFDPAKAISDSIRWLQKSVPADEKNKRNFRLLERRLRKIKKDLTAYTSKLPEKTNN